MTPARRPAWSWVPASDGPISSLPLRLNVRGRAPNLSWLASVLDVVAVKLPVICETPLVIKACEDGAVMISPSSTMAKRFCCGVRACVTVLKTPVPLPLSLISTSHWAFCES